MKAKLKKLKTNEMTKQIVKEREKDNVGRLRVHYRKK